MGHKTFQLQKMGHERKKVENHWSNGLLDDLGFFWERSIIQCFFFSGVLRNRIGLSKLSSGHLKSANIC